MTRLRGGLAVLAPGTADTCPVCQRDHQAMDPFWTCPDHRHQLKFSQRDGDFEVYRCPAHRCPYTRSAPPKPRSPSKGDPMTTALSRPSVAVDQMYARADHLRQLLPPGLDAGSFMGSAAAALYNNAALMAIAEKDRGESLMIALTECAALGHMPDGKNYYLTPRGNKILGIEGYRGIVQRMYNSGQVGKVIVREVCERDHFTFTEGCDEYPEHRFGDTAEPTGAGFFGAGGSVNRGEMVGVYAYAKLLTGEYTRVSLLSREDVHAARAAGGWKPADTYSPWNQLDGGEDHPELRGRSMWWKTALKRSEPWTPTSSEDKRQRAAPRDEQAPLADACVATIERPPAPAVTATQERRQALPAARQKPVQRDRKPAHREQEAPRSDVVTKALRAAIAAQFDRLDLVDEEEREVYVCKLAHKDTADAVTDHDLRGALGDLAECADMEALIKWCDPGEAS